MIREGMKAFDRAVWRNARVIVINDCTRLERSTRENIRQLTGSDVITYEMKYVQVSTDQSFQFRGVVIIVTNLSKSELMSNTGDVALSQRFVEIPFYNTPSPGEINPQLITLLQASIPALINWALYVDPQVMLVQAGALNLDSEPSIFASFIMDNLVFDPSSKISISDLRMHFSEYLNLHGIHPYEIKMPIKRGIINECAATFGCTLTEGRSKHQRYLTGVRLLSKNQREGSPEESNFKMSESYRLDHIDPWSMENRFILEDFEKTLLSEEEDYEKTLGVKAVSSEQGVSSRTTDKPSHLEETEMSVNEPNQAESEPESARLTEDDLEFDSKSQSLNPNSAEVEYPVSNNPVEHSEKSDNSEHSEHAEHADHSEHSEHSSDSGVLDAKSALKWSHKEIGSKLKELVSQTLNDIQSPLNETASRIRELPQVFKSVLEKQRHCFELPSIEMD